MQIRLRSSLIATADNCRRMLRYQWMQKVRALAEPANLTFGRCVDIATREYLRALTLGTPLPDPVADFRGRWTETVRTQVITFAATQSPDTFERMGVDLLRLLPESWDQTGYEVALDADGEPLLDVKLSHFMGQQAGIELYLDGTLDVIVYTDLGDLAVLDVKSASAAHTPLYTARSDQLTSYQILVASNRRKLGLPTLQKLGFWDFLKRRASSRVEKPVLVPLRSTQELSEFRQKCFWIAEDIQRGRFPKASRMQFNTPCEMCEYAQHCVYGDADGLVFPANPVTRTG